MEITINGRQFKVQAFDSKTRFGTTYLLTGARNAQYGVMRTLDEPTFLRAFHPSNGKAVFPGVVFTDVNGTLEARG